MCDKIEIGARIDELDLDMKTLVLTVRNLIHLKTIGYTHVDKNDEPCTHSGNVINISERQK